MNILATLLLLLIGGCGMRAAVVEHGVDFATLVLVCTAPMCAQGNQTPASGLTQLRYPAGHIAWSPAATHEPAARSLHAECWNVVYFSSGMADCAGHEEISVAAGATCQVA